MSNFQLELLGLGAVLIAAVWGYNKFQEVRIRRRLEAEFGPREQARADVLFDAAGKSAEVEQRRTEPTLGEVEAAVSSGFAELEQHVDEDNRSNISPAIAEHPGSVADTEAAISSGSLPVKPAVKPAVSTGSAGLTGNARLTNRTVALDPEIHAILRLSPEQPVSAERIATIFHNLRHAGRQIVRLAGVPVDSADDRWVFLSQGGRYREIGIAAQLANRSGPLNEVEFSGLVTAVAQGAEQLGATAEIPDMMQTIARARALDARCAMLDAQIGINIAKPNGQWAGEAIDALARKHQLTARLDGRFHAVMEDGTVLFVLQNGDGSAFRIDQLATSLTPRLTLLLDVPRTPREHRPFASMAALGNEMAAELGGILVDDSLKTLTPATLAAIERQLDGVYQRLDVEGMSAGSARALTLFS